MHILTFQITDWFHNQNDRRYISGHIWKSLPIRIDENTNRILELLEEFEVKATFFILGWVSENHPGLVRRIYEAGHEIAAYSNWHHSAKRLVPEDFEKDLVMCLSRLENVTGEQITSYRAPGFSLRLKDQWAFDILAAKGITVDSSVELIGQKHKTPIIIKAGDKQILEFPLLKSAISIPYSGGVYFRAMPKFLYNYFFSDKVDKDMYRLLYFHPSDFDSHNPYSNLSSLYRNWLASYNTGNCMDRLRRVLQTYNTCTLGKAVAIYKSKQ